MLENENMIDLSGSLKEMSSEQLSRLIQDETSKESPNDDLVLVALDILENRENESSIELGPKGKAAWKKYQSKVRSRQQKTVLIWKPLMQAASVVLVITLLFALLPTQANAETWWERFVRWTDDFFSFFNPNTTEALEDEYVFKTDNEGLQQVYNAAIELGVTEPVVPMWLPRSYLLEELKTYESPDQDVLIATFNDGARYLVFQICVLHSEISYQYHKDSAEINTYETHGTIFNYVDNYEKKIVIWAKNNYECSLSVDCQDNTLFEIIDSIYRWRSY